jgi:hypothetical protein
MEPAFTKFVSELVTFHGFSSSDPSLYFDRDRAPEYVVCLERQFKGLYQYLTLTTYEGKFVEGVWAVYGEKLNTRAKQKLVPVSVFLPRSFEAILALV